MGSKNSKHRLNQYFDNYNDAVPNTLSMNNTTNLQGSHVSLAHPSNLINNATLSSASLKQNLGQSTHRKNKTSVIGNNPDMIANLSGTQVSSNACVDSNSSLKKKPIPNRTSMS
jgi:hypothetical protein